MEGFTRLENLDADQLQKAATIAAAAMKATECYVDILIDSSEADRERQLQWFFSSNIWLIQQKSPSSLYLWAETPNAQISSSDSTSPEAKCFYMFVPSSEASIGFWDKLRAGLYRMPFECGWGATKRLLATGAWFESQEHEIMGSRRFYSLQRMVVHPSTQGKGVGSKCLSFALRKADQEQMPVLLATQSRRNVTFYERLGFKVAREIKYTATGDPANEYDNFFMVREPATTTSASEEQKN